MVWGTDLTSHTRSRNCPESILGKSSPLNTESQHRQLELHNLRTDLEFLLFCIPPAGSTYSKPKILCNRHYWLTSETWGSIQVINMSSVTGLKVKTRVPQLQSIVPHYLSCLVCPQIVCGIPWKKGLYKFCLSKLSSHQLHVTGHKLACWGQSWGLWLTVDERHSLLSFLVGWVVERKKAARSPKSTAFRLCTRLWATWEAPTHHCFIFIMRPPLSLIKNLIVLTILKLTRRTKLSSNSQMYAQHHIHLLFLLSFTLPFFSTNLCWEEHQSHRIRACPYDPTSH